MPARLPPVCFGVCMYTTDRACGAVAQLAASAYVNVRRLDAFVIVSATCAACRLPHYIVFGSLRGLPPLSLVAVARLAAFVPCKIGVQLRGLPPLHVFCLHLRGWPPLFVCICASDRLCRKCPKVARLCRLLQ